MDCDWNNPGVDPYRGTVAAAVARYDMPQEVRDILAYKAGQLQFDDLVDIYKDRMESRTTKYTNLRDMHFSRNKKCDGSVNRSKWADDHVERAFVFCAKGYCIAIPFVCRNVSLITPITPPTVTIPELPWGPWPKGEPTPMPEPGTLALLLAALGASVLVRRMNGER